MLSRIFPLLRSEPRVRKLMGSLLWGASLASMVSCSAPAPQPLPDVLLLTIDTMRSDRWGCTGDPQARTPFLDRLARGGTQESRARAPSPLTLPSHTTMLTGLAPASHGLRDNGIFRLAADQGRTVAEVFTDRGYVTAAFVSAFPLASKFGLGRGFHVYDDNLGERVDEGEGELSERTAAELVQRVARAFDRGKLSSDGPPIFFWVHMFDPHAPYRAPSPWPQIVGGDGYRAEVGYTDGQIGRLFRELDARRSGRVRRMLVTSDHGESLGEHGELTHGVLLHGATINVPLLTCTERYASRLSEVLVSLEQVPSTLMKLAGIEATLNEGAAPSLDDRERPALAETMYSWFNFNWRALRSWETSRWKLVRSVEDRLYDVANDPGENRNVAAENPDVVQQLRKEFDADWARRSAFRKAAADHALSAEDEAALRSLGYAAAGRADAATIDRGFHEGADPEERVQWVDAINRAFALLTEGRPGEALPLLRDLLRRDPTNRLAWECLGRAELARGNAEASKVAFETALRQGVNPPDVFLLLAEAERALGNPTGERTALEAVLAADSLSVAARYGLFELAVKEDNMPEALRLLQESLEIRPRSAATHLNFGIYYDRIGDLQKAREHWNRAAELDPRGGVGESARARLKSLGVPE